jgi:GNAT superfamily N-acetyltransferase
MLLATRFPQAPDAAAFLRGLDSGGRGFWMANLDGASVGFAAARLIGLDDGSLLVDVEALYVLPEARGVGLGEALMEDVLAWASAAGAVAVDSVALPGDRVTKNFFERFGLTARAIQVHRRLTPTPEDPPD